MNAETKAEMLARITTNDSDGLIFQQNNTEHRCPHFDLMPLKKALQDYIDICNTWYKATALDETWMAVGKAQRELPVHIINEFCREDQSFSPIPRFNKRALPRVLECYNSHTKASETLFPLGDSNSGLGFDFTLLSEVSGGRANAVWRWNWGLGSDWLIAINLKALQRLDEVRTVDLFTLREDLNPPLSWCSVM
jgi:hypothetical protein